MIVVMARMIVIDASVAVALIIDEAKSAMARAVLRACARDEVLVIAPPLLPFEVANALHRRVRDGELTVAQAAGLAGALDGFGIRLETTSDLHERAIALADALDQRAAYDAHYLALAEARDCPFWTADRPFARAAQAITDRVRLLDDFDPDDPDDPLFG